MSYAQKLKDAGFKKGTKDDADLLLYKAFDSTVESVDDTTGFVKVGMANASARLYTAGTLGEAFDSEVGAEEA